jgi:hypothetical protein
MRGPMLQAHETSAALRAMTKRRHATWAAELSGLGAPLASLQREAETAEERRDIRRIWALLTDICEKHSRRAGQR